MVNTSKAPYEVEFSGYLGQDGVHVTIFNRSYDPSPRPNINKDRPANRLDITINGQINFLQRVQTNIDAFSEPGPTDVLLAASSQTPAYTEGIPIPQIGAQKEVVLPYLKTLLNISSEYLVKAGAIKGYPDDVASGVLGVRWAWGIQGNVTKKPASSNVGLVLKRR
jgi:hypothetical protein